MYRRVIAGTLTGCAGLFISALIILPASSGADISDTVEIPRTISVSIPPPGAPDDEPTTAPTRPPRNEAVAKKPSSDANDTPSPAKSKDKEPSGSTPPAPKPSSAPPVPKPEPTPSTTPDPTPSAKLAETTPSATSTSTPEGE